MYNLSHSQPTFAVGSSDESEEEQGEESEVDPGYQRRLQEATSLNKAVAASRTEITNEPFDPAVVTEE